MSRVQVRALDNPISRYNELIVDGTHQKLESAVSSLCYDGFLPDEIAEMARSIAQKYHAEVDERKTPADCWVGGGLPSDKPHER